MLGTLFGLTLDPNNVNSVLPKWNKSLFSDSQSFTLINSPLNVTYILPISLSETSNVHDGVVLKRV